MCMENMLKIFAETSIIIFFNVFILDFTFSMYLLVAQAVGIEYILGLYANNERSYVPIILYILAIMLYILKLVFMPLYHKYVMKQNKVTLIRNVFTTIQKNKKLRILILLMSYSITFCVLLFHTKFSINLCLLSTLILSAGTSYLVLFIYWKVCNLSE